MPTEMNHTDPLSLSDEATEWLIRVRERPDDPDLRSAFEEWILRSPAHRREWERTCRAWRVLGEARKPASSASRQRKTATVPRTYGVAAIAGAGLCLAILFAPSLLIRMRADFTTTTGVSQAITLEDGSRVLLAPDSALASQFSGAKRGVVLLKGEAFFDVAHDRNKPFVVEGGGLNIEVLGTAFDVKLDSNQSEVALARGSIKASASASIETLVPGDVLELDHNSQSVTKTRIPVEDIGSWRDGRLYVVDAPIGSVVAQIQRYHSAWISIPDRALATQRVTGIYDLTTPDEALRALVDPYGGKVRKMADLVRVISRY